ncbi:hypothetical protein BD94_0015 [Elizabethkingia anophelis NUHP1]|uniref:Uncharacterized protein n=1 Tax=Elizabethkingia anophelis NUHP1 TaxID=1338011 RepID=A0A077EE72_9FLAO|nr:hypothetical protein BD94_0015 [Elizabethkingia anophelis NUHP1]
MIYEHPQFLSQPPLFFLLKFFEKIFHTLKQAKSRRAPITIY